MFPEFNAKPDSSCHAGYTARIGSLSALPKYIPINTELRERARGITPRYMIYVIQYTAAYPTLMNWNTN
jgi:hypothetical protein